MAIFNRDGIPVDRCLLERVRQFLTRRGPDEQRIWVGGWNQNVGLVHTMLRTTWEAEREHQPLTLDGSTWIAGHIRVDDRDTLCDKLEACGCHNALDATDSELILHAYRIWGENGVNHLLGDYGFVIWDERERKMICVRDQMGIKPLFYSDLRQVFLASNTLDCIRLHRWVSEDLDHQWISDFLLIGFGLDSNRSVYSAISRLPAAHQMVVNDSGIRLCRYWQLEIGDPIYYKRDGEYCDRFRELIGLSVKDRLRTRRIGIHLSGGLDSSTLAATAAQLVPDPEAGIIGRCHVFRRLISDNEEFYCRIVADHLRIPVQFIESDDASYDDRWDEQQISTPEPFPSITVLAPVRENQRQLALECRVWLEGEGPDNALVFEWRPYVRWLLRRRQWGRCALDAFKLIQLFGTSSVAAALARKIFPNQELHPSEHQDLPDWLKPVSDRGHNLSQRRREIVAQLEGIPFPGEWHPAAYGSLTSMLWPVHFQELDSTLSHPLMEHRFPYVDLRVLGFMLSVPIIPWCKGKALLRESMRSALPEAIVQRPKATLGGVPYRQGAAGRPYRRSLHNLDLMSVFVDLNRLPEEWPAVDPDYSIAARVAGLDIWLATRIASNALDACGAPFAARQGERSDGA